MQIIFPAYEFDSAGHIDTVFAWHSDNVTAFRPSDIDGIILWWSAEDGWIVRPEADPTFLDWFFASFWDGGGIWFLFGLLVAIAFIVTRYLEQKWYFND